MTTITPGDSISGVAVDVGELTNVDGSLIDIAGDYIVDNLGNTISIGGGVPEGNTVISATLTPSDETTATVTVGNDITAVTWG